jgi:hypothetical protein
VANLTTLPRLQAGRVPPCDERRCSRAKLPADLRDRRLNAANQPGHAEQVDLCADVVRICLICEALTSRIVMRLFACLLVRETPSDDRDHLQFSLVVLRRRARNAE